ncbi:hypothetical protein BAX97_04670 [Elizabethkingia meningoseptica]|uniref:hypothetical protein n=1 Tax=Elizabethkingia meningoseptica TaxID=238 RepID=UPI000999FCD4|nr:hypothetical protein [Elizabethkingia meningoseptica]OPC33595.1 hypothetical protein BAX97_04670 [Elizabethkingia meningoseptica]
MKNKIMLIFFFLVAITTYSQELKLVNIIYKNEFQYFTFYNNKTILADEIDPSKNISLFTNDAEKGFESFVKCKKNDCYRTIGENILVSWDFIIPSYLSIKNKILNKKEYPNYLNNIILDERILQKRKKYTLLELNLKNIFIAVLEMSKENYNKYSGSLKLCGNPDDIVTLYRVLNASDEELYFK